MIRQYIPVESFSYRQQSFDGGGLLSDTISLFNAS